jgi:hypothetical protein
MEKIKIEGEEDLVRDNKTQAVLNTNNNSLEAYKMRRDAQRNMLNDVNSLKEEISEIKNLLYQLITEKNK